MRHGIRNLLRLHQERVRLDRVAEQHLHPVSVSHDSRDVNNAILPYRNTGFPTAVTAAGTCEYTVKKCDNKVCTLRLDFDQFSLNSWAVSKDESTFACLDSFEVTTSSGQVIPVICGSNAGQHSKIVNNL